VRGLWCAMLTPLDEAGRLDGARMTRFAQQLLTDGVDGLAPFGTTGEGPSFSVAERRAGLEALLAGGIEPRRLIAATGCAAVTDAIDLTRHALASGLRRCLVVPPFFFKDVPDDALFTFYARLVDGVADPRLRLYLYHIPQFSGVPISAAVTRRLADAYGGVVAGVKDSEGNWSHTAELLERVPGLDVLVGHEPHLPQAMRAGGAGTICGIANVFPAIVRPLLAPDVAPADEGRLRQFIEILFRYPFLPAFKAIKAAQTDDPRWLAVRTPWTPLAERASIDLVAALKAAGLEVGGGRAASPR
jgi:4-hydroxy-tetrahydrodipicolinate synthase